MANSPRCRDCGGTAEPGSPCPSCEQQWNDERERVAASNEDDPCSCGHARWRHGSGSCEGKACTCPRFMLDPASDPELVAAVAKAPIANLVALAGALGRAQEATAAHLAKLDRAVPLSCGEADCETCEPHVNAVYERHERERSAVASTAAPAFVVCQVGQAASVGAPALYQIFERRPGPEPVYASSISVGDNGPTDRLDDLIAHVRLLNADDDTRCTTCGAALAHFAGPGPGVRAVLCPECDADRYQEEIDAIDEDNKHHESEQP